MKHNAKIISRIVRKSKTELDQGRRAEALELMKKALSMDETSGLVVQVIQAIGRKEAKAQQAKADETTEEDAQDAPDEHTQNEIKEEERKSPMTSEDNLSKLFDASDSAFEIGDQAKAVAYLKKARRLDPNNPEIDERVNTLKLKIKSLSIVTIARKKFQAGDIKGAVASARQAFNMMPQALGLTELVKDLEIQEQVASSAVETDSTPPAEIESDSTYIKEIRRLVQDNSLEKAADLAWRSHLNNTDDRLLSEFVNKFRKLGLID